MSRGMAMLVPGFGGSVANHDGRRTGCDGSAVRGSVSEANSRLVADEHGRRTHRDRVGRADAHAAISDHRGWYVLDEDLGSPGPTIGPPTCGIGGVPGV